MKVSHKNTIAIIIFLTLACIAILLLMTSENDENIFQPPQHIDSWKTMTSTENNLTFQYPDTLSTKYSSTVTWPPTITITASNILNCPQTPQESSFPHRITQRMVDQKIYCMEASSEGAAGSVYTTYSYSTIWNNNIVNLDFTLQYPRCENYDNPQQTACIYERESFDLDGVIDRIVDTLYVPEGEEVIPTYTPITTETYTCDNEKTITATYYKGIPMPTPTPGEPPVLTGKVDISLDGNTHLTLFQTISASGIRYANKNESLVFWNKGNEALIMRDNEMDPVYTHCTSQ